MNWTDILINLITGYNFFIFGYFILLNLIYIIILVLSIRGIYFYLKRTQYEGYYDLLSSSFLPQMSILVPCYNEEKTIVDNIDSLLNVEYSGTEIVIINDGSTDDTLARLKEAFDLKKVDRVYKKRVTTEEVKDIYLSAIIPDLVVVDKENGGKADALNAGLNIAAHSLVTAIDADSILEADSLLKMVLPFIEEPQKVVATGGLIRIANNSKIDKGFMEQPRLPKKNLTRFQVVEYLRSFFTGRIGWGQINSLLIVSGAFGVFKREVIADIGGYTPETVGEDMELIVRLHRYFQEQDKEYSIPFVPDATCWTQGPVDIKSFINQRKRWQRGLMDSIINHGKLFFNPNYGAVGLFAFPYYALFEMLGPLLEFIGYISVISSYFLGLLDIKFVGAFFLLTVVYGVFISTSAVGVEAYAEQKYNRVTDYVKLFLYAILENFGYRQFNTIIRALSIIGYQPGSNQWGTISREEFNIKD
ncbi:MAG: glycosyltransferase family 2 protein [Bacillota bacterium]